MDDVRVSSRRLGVDEVGDFVEHSKGCFVVVAKGLIVPTRLLDEVQLAAKGSAATYCKG
jgi:hypothetical protein